MLQPRIIPCLLIHNGALAKTVQFANPKYIGDPLNAVRIFNEKQVDELIVIDIDASRHEKVPDEVLIAKLAAQCRMPLTYGGGVKTVEQVERLIALGVEKVAISSAALTNHDLIPRAVERVGQQSIVGIIDVKSNFFKTKYEVVTMNGCRRSGISPYDFAVNLQEMGVGEIVLNSVDRDGTMLGYDMKLVDDMQSAIDVPLTVLGGAGSLDDIRQLVARYPIIGAAAGSLFVFKGKYKAVLINYPDQSSRKLFCS